MSAYIVHINFVAHLQNTYMLCMKKIPENVFYIDYFVAKCYLVSRNKHIFIPFGIPWSVKAKAYSKQILKTPKTAFMFASDANYTVKAIYYVKIPKIAWYIKDELYDATNIE